MEKSDSTTYYIVFQIEEQFVFDHRMAGDWFDTTPEKLRFRRQNNLSIYRLFDFEQVTWSSVYSFVKLKE